MTMTSKPLSYAYCIFTNARPPKTSSQPNWCLDTPQASERAGSMIAIAGLGRTDPWRSNVHFLHTSPSIEAATADIIVLRPPTTLRDAPKADNHHRRQWVSQVRWFIARDARQSTVKVAMMHYFASRGEGHMCVPRSVPGYPWPSLSVPSAFDMH